MSKMLRYDLLSGLNLIKLLGAYLGAYLHQLDWVRRLNKRQKFYKIDPWLFLRGREMGKSNTYLIFIQANQKPNQTKKNLMLATKVVRIDQKKKSLVWLIKISGIWSTNFAIVSRNQALVPIFEFIVCRCFIMSFLQDKFHFDLFYKTCLILFNFSLK